MAFYNQSSSFPHDNGGYYNHIPYESGYYNHASYSYSYSYYPPPQSSAGLYSYEYVPTQSLIAYSACNDVAYTHPGSVQYAVYHSVAAPPLDDDLNFIEYDPHPYGGGYDIDQTYGKPLPPSDEICYPPSSIALNLPTPAVVVPVVQEQEEEEEEEEEELPVKEEAGDLRIEAPETEEEEESDTSDAESEEDSVQVNEVAEENNYGKVVDQIPPGYGLEAYDLCESLFGYWPCLSKMKTKKKCGECGNEISVGVGGDDVDEWKRTADYLFGNPDPYGGWTDQGGYPSGNTLYGYDQMQYQHQPTSALVLYEQADQYGHNSWFL